MYGAVNNFVQTIVAVPGFDIDLVTGAQRQRVFEITGYRHRAILVTGDGLWPERNLADGDPYRL